MKMYIIFGSMPRIKSVFLFLYVNRNLPFQWLLTAFNVKVSNAIFLICCCTYYNRHVMWMFSFWYCCPNLFIGFRSSFLFLPWLFYIRNTFYQLTDIRFIHVRMHLKSEVFWFCVFVSFCVFVCVATNEEELVRLSTILRFSLVHEKKTQYDEVMKLNSKKIMKSRNTYIYIFLYIIVENVANIWNTQR